MPLSLYAWYSLNTLELLGQRHAQIAGEIEFKRLTRFRDLLNSQQGSVRVELKFGQHAAGYTTVRLEYAASFELQCQRCLEPVGDRVARQMSFALVAGGSGANGLPEGYEPIGLSGDRFQPAAFVEHELIMSLPLIPRHARVEQCGELAQRLEALENPSGTGPMGTAIARH